MSRLLKECHKIYTPCLLRCHFQQHGSDDGEDDVWEPCAEHRWQSARDGKHRGYLLQEDEGENQTDSYEDVYTDSAGGLPARHTHA